MPPSSKTSVLKSLYEVGERIHTALQKNDIDAFAELTKERGGLIDQLRAFDHSDETDSDWQDLADALREQHQAIETALEACHEDLEQQLHHAERQEDARDQYAPPLPEQRNQILNKDLQG